MAAKVQRCGAWSRIVCATRFRDIVTAPDLCNRCHRNLPYALARWLVWVATKTQPHKTWQARLV